MTDDNPSRVAVRADRATHDDTQRNLRTYGVRPRSQATLAVVIESNE